jgi:Uma2 family endonuclease
MSFVTTTTAKHMSGTEFRAFQMTRSDHERWELVKGIPVMMVPPTITHNLIAGNLDYLLRQALAKHNPRRRVLQRTGVELGDTALAVVEEEYRPEPDLVVIDADFGTGQRFAERVYVIVEIVSDTDHQRVPGTKEPWIQVKRRLYLNHPWCEAVLLIAPTIIDVRVDLRAEGRWESTGLTQTQDILRIPSCGLECRVADLYAGAPLEPRR